MSEANLQNSHGHGETKILIDYFCFSVFLSDFLGYESETYDYTNLANRIEKKFLLSGLPFQERHGMYGYNFARYFNGIIYAYGGMNTVYVQMSGTGCRTWESSHPGLKWDAWIKHLQSTYCSLHISRLDVACDTFGKLNIATIQRWTRHRRFISRWKTWLIQEGTDENSVIWGSSKSDFRLRIYDKSLERRRVVEDPDQVPSDWVRCEFQLRNDSVKSFVREWLRSKDIGSTFMGIMNNQLLYVRRYDGKNRDRSEVCRWWAQLLGDAKQIKMAYEGGQDYNLQSLQRFLFRQAGSSLKAYLTYTDGDLEPLMRGIDSAKLNDRQQDLLRVELPKRRSKIESELERQKKYAEWLEGSGRN